MINLKETKQQFHGFSKNALKLLTIALRSPLMLMMGCGYVDFGGRRHELHDHGETKMVEEEYIYEVPYDQNEHGEIIEFLNEGERIPNHSISKDAKVPVHHHNGTSSTGPYEYTCEKRSV